MASCSGVVRISHTIYSKIIVGEGCGQNQTVPTGSCLEQRSGNCPHQSKIKDLMNRGTLKVVN